tara:strand:+ start:272 stop:919 length:648 start_codon:yes stop_codon:yes gene_type:complete
LLSISDNKNILLNSMRLILITGPSGSGKTSLSKVLSNELKNTYILCTDNFYKTGIISNLLSQLYTSYFDKLISHNKNLLENDIKYIIRNKEIKYYYLYDFKKRTSRKIYRPFSNIENLIIEGIFSLEQLDYASNYEYLLLKIKTKKKTCLKRIINRDQLERGKNISKIPKAFNIAWKLYKERERKYQEKGKINELIIREPFDFKNIVKKITTKKS